MNKKQIDYLIMVFTFLISTTLLTFATILAWALLKVVSILVTSNYIDVFVGDYSPARLVFILIISILVDLILIYYTIIVADWWFEITIKQAKKIYLKKKWNK